MNISDVMIHINESLSKDELSALENAMRKIDGVVSPRFNPGKEHLMMIAFDPEKTTSAVLLGKVTTAGYTAQLIGA